MDRQRSEGMGGWVSGWMDSGIEGRMNGWVDGGWLAGWMGEWVDGCIGVGRGERMNECLDG